MDLFNNCSPFFLVIKAQTNHNRKPKPQEKNLQSHRKVKKGPVVHFEKYVLPNFWIIVVQLTLN